jgi:hypothetical protein
MLKKKTFFTRVGTYVQRGSMFCFVALVVLVLADTLLRILHYCPISPCFQHIAPLHAPLPCSLAPAVRPISTRFDARARWLRSHRTVLHWQVTKLHARVAVLTGLNLFLVQFHHAFIMCHQTACARCCTNRFKLVFCPISPCFHYLHARAAVQQTGSNLFSCSYVDLLHHN